MNCKIYSASLDVPAFCENIFFISFLFHPNLLYTLVFDNEFRQFLPKMPEVNWEFAKHVLVTALGEFTSTGFLMYFGCLGVMDKEPDITHSALAWGAALVGAIMVREVYGLNIFYV